MPSVRGRDRLEPTEDGTVVLLSRHRKPWTPRGETAPGLPRAGTTVRWDEELYEVVSVEPRPGGGFRHVLAPLDERQLIRSVVEYGAEPGGAVDPGNAGAAVDWRSWRSWRDLPEAVRILGTAGVVAVLLGWFFPVRVLGEGISFFTHELGHTFVGWFFGCSAFPAVVLTIAFAQSRAFAALVWAVIVASAVKYRHVPRWNAALAGGALLYPALAFTDAYLVAFDLGGHLAEAAAAAWMLSRALSDERPAWERWVLGFFAFALVRRNVWLFAGLVVSASARTDYLTIAIAGENDLVKVARMTGVSLEVLGGLLAVLFLAVPAVVLVRAARRRG